MKNKKIINGRNWLDTDQNAIHAHGGHMLQSEGYYYWYGENRINKNLVGCYRSTDLVNWEFRNIVLSADSKYKKIEYETDPRLFYVDQNGKNIKVNVERPKVLYSQKLNKFVMWFHWENGLNYLDARCGIATCDKPDGDFTFHGSFNPCGFMSRDCTLFRDDDGTAYFISAARDNKDIHIYRLTDDYLGIDSHVNTLWEGCYREAPAVFKRNGKYCMISSKCSGWLPNQGKYAVADSMDGVWSELELIGDITTYDTQPAFVLQINGTERTSFIYISDRWDPRIYQESTYVFLPIEFKDNKIGMEYFSSISINVMTGEVTGEAAPNSDRVRIRTNFDSENIGCSLQHEDRLEFSKLNYKDESQMWRIIRKENGTVNIQNIVRNRYLAITQENTVMLSVEASDFYLKETEEGRFYIIDAMTNATTTLDECNEGFIITKVL